MINFFLCDISAFRRFLRFMEQRGWFLHAAALIALDATACSYSDFVLSKGPTIPHISELYSTQEIPRFNYDGPSSYVSLYPMTCRTMSILHHSSFNIKYSGPSNPPISWPLVSKSSDRTTTSYLDLPRSGFSST